MSLKVGSCLLGRFPGACLVSGERSCVDVSCYGQEVWVRLVKAALGRQVRGALGMTVLHCFVACWHSHGNLEWCTEDARFLKLENMY